MSFDLVNKIINIFCPKDYYERDSLLQNYICSQYGPFLKDKKYEKSESFYQKIIEESKFFLDKNSSVLDVGCATGRIVFEYKKLGVKKISGIDTSSNFINYCNFLKNNESKEILFDFQKQNNQTVEFFNKDIIQDIFEANLFDFISCINVFDRVSNPKILIEKLYLILRSGGVLLLVDPYDWGMSPSPKKFHVSDMKLLLDSRIWFIEKEMFNVPYVIKTGVNSEREYKCHFIIAKKL